MALSFARNSGDWRRSCTSSTASSILSSADLASGWGFGASFFVVLAAGGASPAFLSSFFAGSFFSGSFFSSFLGSGVVLGAAGLSSAMPAES